jgi:hypothetical protein
LWGVHSYFIHLFREAKKALLFKSQKEKKIHPLIFFTCISPKYMLNHSDRVKLRASSWEKTYTVIHTSTK